MHEIKNEKNKQKPKQVNVTGFTTNTQSKAALQTDRPTEQSALPYPETKPVLAVFEKTLDSVELTENHNFNATTKSLL